MKQRYIIPAVGTVFPAQQNLYIDNPGPLGGTVKMTQWLQAQEQDRAYSLNDSLEQTYLARFQDWLQYEYLTGRAPGGAYPGDPDAPPPQPPAAYAVMTQAAEAGGVSFVAQQIAGPVCDVPAYAKIPPPQHLPPAA